MVICFILFLEITHLLIAQDSVKIMTYNLEGMKPGTNPATRIYYDVQFLKTLNPDIIGVQEINESLNTNGADNQATVIADSLSAYFGIPYYVYVGFTHLSWDNTFNEYVGIITKYPVLQTGYFQLVKGAFPRKVVWNQINTPIGKINFFNTHLDHKTADIRVQQVKEIISYIADRDSVSPSIASILTGDFNDKPTTSTILSLTNTGTGLFFKDTYPMANPTLQGYTNSSQTPNRRIDYIFYKNGGKLTIASSKIVMDVPYTGIEYCSDHYGVMTTFTRTVAGIHYEGGLHAPDHFELYQNYPNPFNPSTTLSYYVPQTQNVTLRIYNFAGQIINTLVNEIQSAGFKSLLWNGKNQSSTTVASGVYVVQLAGNGFVQTRKLLFVK